MGVPDDAQLRDVAERRRRAGDPLWWQTLGECRVRDADLSIFITAGDQDDDPWYPPDGAMAFCNLCPVRVHCLDYGLAHHEHGVWGGTSEYQRRQLRRAQSRATCPGCGGHDIVVEGRHEVCLGCAVSWPTLDARQEPVDRRKATG